LTMHRPIQKSQCACLQTKWYTKEALVLWKY
jgi:hypothetical protein